MRKEKKKRKRREKGMLEEPMDNHFKR